MAKAEEEWTKSELIPRLRRMGFVRVTYVHGTSEAGRDVVFADWDRFGLLKYYAAQVKVGGVTARKETAALRTILDQLKTAYEMPYRDPATGTEHQVAGVYLIVHGSITDQARAILYEKTGQWFHLVDDDQLLIGSARNTAVSQNERAYRLAVLGAELTVSVANMRRFRDDIVAALATPGAQIDLRKRLHVRSVERVLDFVALHPDTERVADLLGLLWAMDGLNRIIDRLPIGDCVTGEARTILQVLPPRIDEFLGRAEVCHTTVRTLMQEMGSAAQSP
jgi:hypothetical protein